MIKDGRLTVVLGRSRYGKSTLIERRTRKARRLLVYDTKGVAREWASCHSLTSRALLFATLEAAGGGPGRYKFIDTGALAIDFFCKCAMWWAKKYGPLTVVAEDIAEVTTTAKARGAWGALLRTGLGMNITIYTIAQRPQDIDKTSISNAHEMIVFHMKRADDRLYMARETGAAPADLDALGPYQYLIADDAGVRLKK